MEVHKELGKGFSEIIYGDALEIEFNKNNILPHYYFADFVVNNNIILEIKAIETLTNSHLKQTLNYLAASKLRLGLLINFGENSLSYKRIIL